MVNFGPLAAEIVSLVWGTPANFNGFGVLAALLHGILVVGVSQTFKMQVLNAVCLLFTARRNARIAKRLDREFVTSAKKIRKF